MKNCARQWDFLSPHSLDPHWPNLRLRLREVHARQDDSLGRLTAAKDTHVGYTIIEAIFRLVFSLKDLSWERVESILVEQRKVLVKIDRRWGDDKEMGSASRT